MNNCKFKLKFVLLLMLFSGFWSKAQNVDQPNILFLVVEDSSPYLFPAYGNKTIETPNLNYLAKNGVVFNNAFANGPQCSPARSSLISGSYATTYGNDWHRNGHIVPQNYFFPQYLRQAGYFCVNAGKTDYNVTKAIQKKYYPLVWDKMSGYRSADKPNVSYNDADRKGKPFFAQFNNMTTHMSRITSVSVNNREPSRINPKDVVLPPHVPDIPEMRADYALHLDGVQDADKWVGFFIDDLKKRKLLENTIIFFFSDHGGCLPRGKAFPFETGFRSALIISAPQKWKHLLPALQGQKSDQIVEFADFGPTLLNVSGTKIPEHMQGKPFMGPNAQKRAYAHSFRTNTGIHFDPSRAISDGDFHYIKYYTPYKVHGLKQSFQWGMPSQNAWDDVYHKGDSKVEHKSYYESKPDEDLFDSKKDPWNMKSLADDSAYAETLINLRKQASKHIRETRDLGFFPKGVRDEFVSQGISLYEWVRAENYPLDELYDLVEKASLGNALDQAVFMKYLKHKRPEFRFWAASGLACMAYHGNLKTIPKQLLKACDDKWNSVAATAAEALALAGHPEKGIPILIEQANGGNELSLSSLEELGSLVAPFIEDIKHIAANSKNKEIKFLSRGILINFGELPMNQLFDSKTTNKFIKTQKKRIKDWAPTLPN